MTLDELIPSMARFFRIHGIRYFTFGGVAVSIWGQPRTTKDLDIVVCIERRAVPSLSMQLNALGFRITKLLQRNLMEGRIRRTSRTCSSTRGPSTSATSRRTSNPWKPQPDAR